MIKEFWLRQNEVKLPTVLEIMELDLWLLCRHHRRLIINLLVQVWWRRNDHRQLEVNKCINSKKSYLMKYYHKHLESLMQHPILVQQTKLLKVQNIHTEQWISTWKRQNKSLAKSLINPSSLQQESKENKEQNPLIQKDLWLTLKHRLRSKKNEFCLLIRILSIEWSRSMIMCLLAVQMTLLLNFGN